MKIVFDPDKDDWNIRHRGLSFEQARDLEFETAIFLNDDRKAYGEQRLIAIGYLGDRLHILCFTPVPEGIRVISFRKANAREAEKYGKPKTKSPD
ncbi:conserved hypothetical protein [Rhodospirillaceae bacterium LM-1]|nr:conserved hypothetical protein [Rhodospirillaceae bacterium LM-1]